MPGDEIVIERQNRAKGESRFSPTRYTIIEQRNGSLVLNDNDGKVTKRHVSQTKRIGPWRDSHGQKAIVSSTKHIPTDGDTNGINSAEPVQRPSRERKVPTFLNDYVRLID